MLGDLRDTACKVRVVTTYSTSWHYQGTSSEDLGDRLELGGLQRHYELYKDQLPRLLPFDLIGGGTVGEAVDVRLIDLVDGIGMARTDALLFALPSNQVVLAVILEFTTQPLRDLSSVKPITRVLEQCIENEVRIGGKDLQDFVRDLPTGDLVWEGLAKDDQTGSDDALLPERHQLVFVERRNEEERAPGPVVINEIVYRETPPYREEFGIPKTPEQLNAVKLSDRPFPNGRSWLQALRQEPVHDANLSTLGVVTPYVSLLYGHQRYVEDSIFLSTVHAVGTSSRFRQIWHDAYQQVRQFKERKQSQEAGLQTRADLEELADNLGNLEFDLTFSVEFPLMRIETFQTALYEAMDLSNQAKALSQMFDQLDGSLRSEITAIDVRERRRNDGRQKWNAFAAGVLSLIGVSVGFVIAFLGVNTTEVPDDGGKHLSMWDPHFAYLYLIAGVFALVPVFLISFPYLREWTSQTRGRRPLWCGLAATAAGAVVLAATLAEDWVAGRTIVFDAIGKAVAAFALLVGLTMGALWLWYRRARHARRQEMSTLGRG
ncbi:hypothetical protein GCM10027176_67600 [Actinoallomurus bryophytorum]|uniref:CorA-like Mg2+ transporter protein n=1 Tax=Actinoallomurus bryophytorum TaxID=1490222 RepID=A0A543BSM0_9ACTN|nr:hypothetical protein [Actinoallomurus bryophytorum]TQL87828.1 hypothetical protein FB559_8437 [Actinoallomurus bryophytorum]